MALIIRIPIFLFKKNYHLAQLYTKIQSIGHPEIRGYLKA
jgi:hypothetical protein